MWEVFAKRQARIQAIFEPCYMHSFNWGKLSCMHYYGVRMLVPLRGTPT